MSIQELSRDELVEVIEELDREAAELEEERDEWEKKAKKFKADFENYKKKQDERKERWQGKAQQELAESLIEVIDNLERAIASADEETAVVKGVKMVADQLHDELEKRGLERIDAEGEEFDPRYHKAVESREHDEDDVVLEQKKPGYVFDEKVLREAEVVVSEKEES